MKKNRKFINAILVSSMMLSGLALDVSAAEGKNVTRLEGSTRVQTSIAVSEKAHAAPKTVVLAGYYGQVDALTGTLLAAAHDAPLLYVSNHHLASVKAHIDKIGAEKIILLGGNLAIKDNIEKDLKDTYGDKNVRRVEGSTRYHTAAKVAGEVNDGKATEVFVTNDGNKSLADALVAGPVSGEKEIPVLLTDVDSLHPATKQAIKDLGATKVTVVGGYQVVSDAVLEELNKIEGVTATREAGANRYKTATAFAEKYFPNSKSAIITNGDKLEDAVVGGYYGAEIEAPILFTKAGLLHEETTNYLGGKAMHAYVLGGTEVVSKAVETAVETVIDKNIKDSVLAVDSVSAINGTQAEVTFNKEVKEVKPANFKVTDKDGNLVFVSKVELNEAKTVATLTFFEKFADKGIYTVETSNVKDVDGNAMEKDTSAFAYQAAEVSKVEFKSTKIATGGTNNVKNLVKVTDALGRDVTKEVAIELESSKVSVVANDGTLGAEGSAIVVAKVKVGDSYVKSAPTAITVKDAVAAKFAGYYVDGTVKGSTKDFKELKDEDKINYVYLGDTDRKLGLYFEDQYGESMANLKANAADVTVTNLTPNVAIVETSGVDFKIKSFSAGDAYVKIKVGDIETTVKIVVREKSKITTMAAEKTNISVGTNASVNNETIKVEYKNQFNADATPAPGNTLKAKVADDAIALATPAADGKTVTITGLKEGSTTVELSYKVDDDTTLKQTLNVTVTKAGTLASYKVENKATKLDVKGDVNDNKKLPEVSEVNVFSTDANGNKIDKITLDGSINKLVAVDKDGKADSSIVNVTGNNTVKAVKAGTGYVQVKVGSLVIETLEFEVVNTAEVAKTASFDSVAIVLPEYKTNVTAPVLLSDELEKIVKVKNQNGTALTGFDETKLKFEYTVTNKSGVTITGSANTESLTALTEKNGSADIVVTKVTYDTGTENLISTPVVVKLSSKDITGPVATFTDSTGMVVTFNEDTTLADGTTLSAAITAADDATKKKALYELLFADGEDLPAVDGSKLTFTSSDAKNLKVEFTDGAFGTTAVSANNTISIKANAFADVVGNKNLVTPAGTLAVEVSGKVTYTPAP